VGEVEPINRILVPGQTGEAPAISDAFRQRLRETDPDLCVAWNSIKKRFVIEQCVKHLSGTVEHSHVCDRLYVLMVQDEDGCMLPLGDKVIEMIKARDVSKLGYGPNDLNRFQTDIKNAAKEEIERRQKAGEAAIRYGSRHNRRQLLQAIHLVQQHNLTPNK